MSCFVKALRTWLRDRFGSASACPDNNDENGDVAHTAGDDQVEVELRRSGFIEWGDTGADPDGWGLLILLVLYLGNWLTNLIVFRGGWTLHVYVADRDNSRRKVRYRRKVDALADVDRQQRIGALEMPEDDPDSRQRPAATEHDHCSGSGSLCGKATGSTQNPQAKARFPGGLQRSGFITWPTAIRTPPVPIRHRDRTVVRYRVEHVAREYAAT